MDSDGRRRLTFECIYLNVSVGKAIIECRTSLVFLYKSV